jgi:hypothetical protein
VGVLLRPLVVVLAAVNLVLTGFGDEVADVRLNAQVVARQVVVGRWFLRR